MKSLLLLLTLNLSLNALAQSAEFAGRDQSHRFPSFAYQGSQAVFLDFVAAQYHLIYDANQATTSVQSEIDFEQAEPGYPIFDLIAEPTRVFIDGISVRAPEVKTPDQATTLRIISQRVEAGKHHLSIQSPLVRNDPATNGFFMDDSLERFFLERYLPASFEYDHLPMQFNVEFINFKESWKVYANGKIEEGGKGNFKITFPNYFNSSAVFFHAVPENFVQETRFVFSSMNGKAIPVTYYFEPSQAGLSASSQKITEDLRSLENLYGPFPHASLTIYFAKNHVEHFNDMEYSGATIATLRSLYHELAHSYFARGIMPSNGNSNWIDEAIADWTERALPSSQTLPSRSKLASLPLYSRYCWNIGEAYGMSQFLGYLSQTYKIREFLKFWQTLRFGQSVSTEDMIEDLGNFLGVSMQADFLKRVY